MLAFCKLNCSEDLTFFFGSSRESWGKIRIKTNLNFFLNLRQNFHQIAAAFQMRQIMAAKVSPDENRPILV